MTNLGTRQPSKNKPPPHPVTGYLVCKSCQEGTRSARTLVQRGAELPSGTPRLSSRSAMIRCSNS